MPAISELIKQISISLKQDNTDINRKRWSAYIIENTIPIVQLTELMHHEHPIAMRFSWVLGDIADNHPEALRESVPYFFKHRNEIKFPNFNRSLAKFFYLSGVPEEIEGEAIDELFKWLMDAKMNVTTKTFSLLALHRLTLKHKDLQQELKLVIEDQLGKTSVSFENKARKILAELKEK